LPFRRNTKCLQHASRNKEKSVHNGKENRHAFSLRFFSDSGAILGSRIYQNWQKKLLGSTPGAFLKPSWCPETFLKRLGVDFGVPKTRFWIPWGSFLKGCEPHVGVFWELFSLVSFFFRFIFRTYLRTYERKNVRTYVRTSVRPYVLTGTHARI
jgi:hypothetical protein